jgi:hypothetical protein
VRYIDPTPTLTSLDVKVNPIPMHCYSHIVISALAPVPTTERGFKYFNDVSLYCPGMNIARLEAQSTQKMPEYVKSSKMIELDTNTASAKRAVPPMCKYSQAITMRVKSAATLRRCPPISPWCLQRTAPGPDNANIPACNAIARNAESMHKL